MSKESHSTFIASADPSTPRPLLTIKQVAGILKVTPATVRELKIPVVRISTQSQAFYRYKPKDVELYIRDHIKNEAPVVIDSYPIRDAEWWEKRARHFEDEYKRERTRRQQLQAQMRETCQIPLEMQIP